jgi:hypothetical protein
MKADLVRTNEENRRHKELVDMNRLRRKLLRQKQEEKQLLIPQVLKKQKKIFDINLIIGSSEKLSNALYLLAVCHHIKNSRRKLNLPAEYIKNDTFALS